MPSASGKSGLIEPAVLLTAYAHGVFPMARSANDKGVFWCEPDPRCVIPLEGLHIPARLARTVRSTRFAVKVDTAFRAVMLACAAAAPGRGSTWINNVILNSFCRLHDLGHAHSVEVWSEQDLVGGLYGVRLGAAFFGESMFSRARDVSKIALVHLAGRLRAGGFCLLDAQYKTAHLAQFGAVEISREAYLEKLHEAEGRSANFYELGPPGVAVSGRVVLHETTQTS